MFTVDDARRMANEWRPKFADESAFELSWSRYFETATVPDAQRLEAWLAKDQAKDAVKHAGIVKEPLLPTRQRYAQNDCRYCEGKRYVRQDVGIDHPDFGKAIPCPRCNA